MPSPTDSVRRRLAAIPVRPSRWSLLTRLIAGLVCLVALVCLAIGVVTDVALQRSLIGRLDAQLTAAGGRSTNAGESTRDNGSGPGQPPHGQDHGAQFLLAPGQAAGTLGARIANGQLTAAGVLDDTGTLQPLPNGQTRDLIALPTDGQPHTCHIGDHGDYRLLATRTPDGDVLITGLPLTSVQNTLWQNAAVELVVAGAALTLTTAIGVVIIRRTLRPLQRVAATATRVSTLPLERGEVALAERVTAADTDPRTEVGQVGAALNRLLDHVSAALTARQASELRVRQFVADASHELRTPLAAIRGYAGAPGAAASPPPPTSRTPWAASSPKPPE